MEEAVSPVDRFQSFCQQLTDHSQSKEYRIFTAGSTTELNWMSMSTIRYQSSLKNVDVDFMKYSYLLYAFPIGRPVPESYKGEVLRIHPEELHPGYVKLIHESDNSEYIQVRDTSKQYNGPAEVTQNEKEFEQTLRIIEGSDIFNLPSFRAYQYESVTAVHSPYWPWELAEWVMRERFHGSPTKKVVKQVVRYGCDFVCVSHKLSENRGKNNEWRYSLSMAELIIIRNWTDNQRILYRALRVIYKMIEETDKRSEKPLCTYYFKTLMLWSCEERPAEFWAEESLVESLHTLLLQMIEWLNSRHCVNYFVRANNMMDHLRDVDVSREIDILRSKVAAKDDLFPALIEICTREEVYSNNMVYHLKIPQWIYSSMYIKSRINSPTYRNYFECIKSSPELTNALDLQLFDIFQGIELSKRLAECTNEEERNDCLRQSRERFTRQIGFFESETGRTKIIRIVKFVDIAGRLQALYSRHSTKAVNDLSEELTIEDTATPHWLQENAELFSVSRSLFFENDSWHRVDRHGHFVGLSPTVHISWFIGQAYLANLLCTAQCDYAAATEICDTIISTYNLSEENRTFAEHIFPVVLSTQWVKIYDDQIKQLLGFFSLCSYAYDKTDSRSVYVGVCPIHFALYIKLRCISQQKSSEAFVNCCHEYVEHGKKCAFENGQHAKNGLSERAKNSAFVNENGTTDILAIALWMSVTHECKALIEQNLRRKQTTS